MQLPSDQGRGQRRRSGLKNFRAALHLHRLCERPDLERHVYSRWYTRVQLDVVPNLGLESLQTDRHLVNPRGQAGDRPVAALVAIDLEILAGCHIRDPDLSVDYRRALRIGYGSLQAAGDLRKYHRRAGDEQK